MARYGFFYIMTNKYNTALYCGVTNNLARRVAEHKEKPGNSFVGKYVLNKLVYYEMTERVVDAIEREKQIKGGSRQQKIDLITSINPEWKDLYDEVLED